MVWLQDFLDESLGAGTCTVICPISDAFVGHHGALGGFVQSIFSRDHPGTAADEVVDAFAEAIPALDDSVPNGTYIDMCSNLPLVDPKKILAPTIVMRGEYDGIAGFDDLIAFFSALPNADKQFSVMPGISHASFQQRNYLLVYHILHGFLKEHSSVDTTFRF